MIALPEISPVLAAALVAELTPWLVIPTTTECAATANYCPVSKRADGRHAWGFDGDDPYIICAYCDRMVDAHNDKRVYREGSGRVPFDVEVGDTLTARISNELPDKGKWFGEYCIGEATDDEAHHLDGESNATCERCPDPDDGLFAPECSALNEWLPALLHDERAHGMSVTARLRPGCLLSVTVAANPDNTPAVLPIVARRHFYPTSTYEPGGGPWLGFDAGTFKGDPEELSLVRRRNGLFEWTDMSAELAWQDYTPDETQAVQVEGVEVTP